MRHGADALAAVLGLPAENIRVSEGEPEGLARGLTKFLPPPVE